MPEKKVPLLLRDGSKPIDGDLDDLTESSLGESGFFSDLKRLRRLATYMRPYRRRLISGLAAGAVYGAVSGAFPKAVQYVFKELFEGSEKPSFWIVLATALAIPTYYLIRGFIGFLNTYLLSWVGGRMLRDIRVELFEHLQYLPMDFFVSNRVGSLIQRVSQSTATMQRSLVNLAGDVIKQPVTIVVAIGVLASINLFFCLFALLVGVVCMIPMTLIGRKVRNASRAEDASAGAVIGVLHETFSNVRVIKAYLLEKIRIKSFRQAANRQMNRSLRFKRQREMLSPMIEWIGSLAIGAALIYVYFTDMPFSEFLAVMAGFFLMYDPLKKMGRMHVMSQRIIVVSDRVFGLMDLPRQHVDTPNAVKLEKFESEIRYENVGLQYVREQDVLSGINLTIPRGSVCALVGPSGSGKTSIVNLLLRFYEPSAGRVLIDGHDLTGVTAESVRGLIGIVTQETFLFADSVAGNIALGRPKATREEIVEAARQAQAHEFIMSMPKQYDTILSDRGQNLSGGQCQRIAIARAILKNPSILVLDEATSALDAESERQVQEAMAQLMQGRTVIMIAHRLASIRHADQFVVLDQGRILEVGGHDELILKDGLYRRLYDLQVV